MERLEALLEEHRRREVDEASTLEKALEQVDDNLKATQQRALLAETQLVQLRKDNRRLTVAVFVSMDYPVQLSRTQ